MYFPLRGSQFTYRHTVIIGTASLLLQFDLFLFHYGLCNDAVNHRGQTVTNDWMKVNGEFKRIWKEVVVAKFKVVSWHSRGETQETTKTSAKIVTILAKI
jgi:hypothetical protein